MKHFHTTNMTELHDALVEGLIHSKADELDVVSSVDVQQHDVIAEADSMEWDFDLKTSWLTKQRWNMLQKMETMS